MSSVIESSNQDSFIAMKAKGMLQPFTPASISLYRSPGLYDAEHYWHTSRLSLSMLNDNGSVPDFSLDRNSMPALA